MLVICLNNVTATDIILVNFLVLAAHQELVFLFWVRIELNTKWYSLGTEFGNTLS